MVKETVDLKTVIRILSKNHAWGDIDKLIQSDIRHKTDATTNDYLKSFLTVSRCFGYATKDDSWGEFEKQFKIIIMRLVKAEQMCADNGIELQ